MYIIVRWAYKLILLNIQQQQQRDSSYLSSIIRAWCKNVYFIDIYGI